jgi:hypothetical protein
MNARQRRKAYRALPKRGTFLEILLPYRGGPDEVWKRVRVLGYSAPVFELGGTPDVYNYSGERPSVYRVRVEILSDGLELSGRMTPLVAKLREVPPYMRHLLPAA